MAKCSYPVIQCKKTGRRMKALRKAKGIKVPAVCVYMGGISEQAVYKWERGASLPTIDNLLALSRLYEVKMEELLVYEEIEMVSSFFSERSRLPFARRMEWFYGQGDGEIRNYRIII